MLIQSIKQKNGEKNIKLASIEQIRASNHAVPPQIHSVPALMFIQNKNVIYFGKQVFDYLFAPGSGILMVENASLTPAATKPTPDTASSDGPSAFSLIGENTLGDSYSMIVNDNMTNANHDHNNTAWGPLDTPGVITNDVMQLETRTKKDTLDIDALRAERAKDIRGYAPIASSAHIPPTATR